MKQITHKEAIEQENIKSSLKKHIKKFYNTCPDLAHSSGIYQNIIMIIDEVLIEETLIYTGGVQAKAAQILGINRNTLRKKIEQLRIGKE
jgi:two-component system nitrogen regulation response regulator GlnG